VNIRATFSLAVLAAYAVFSVSAIAQVPIELSGTWVIDARQTEEYLKKVGPPPNHADWLPSFLLRMCVSTMTFDGETMTWDGIGPAPFGETFRLKPQGEKKLTYGITSSDGKEDTLIISFRGEGHITVKSVKMEFMEYGVWKRGRRSSPEMGEADFKEVFASCSSALNNVPFIRARTR
jgi:hypothetical protein